MILSVFLRQSSESKPWNFNKRTNKILSASGIVITVSFFEDTVKVHLVSE